MPQAEDLDLFGRVTARAHSYLKRHPRLRIRAIAMFNAADKLIDGIAYRPPVDLSGTVDPHRWVADWNHDAGHPPASIKDLFAPEATSNVPALGLHENIDPEYRRVASVTIPAPFLAEIPEGHVLGEHGAVATPDGQVIDRVSRPVGSLNAHLSGYNADDLSPTALQVEWRRRPKRIDQGAVLSTFVGRGYFHWLFDVLPRLRLLEDGGVPLSAVRRFVVPSYFARYQIETLARFDIGRDRIVSSFQHRHVLAKRLLLPAHPRETGLIPSWVCNFLRETFPPKPPPGVDPIPRIYIVRRQTDHGLLGNEAKLTQRLKDLGFTPVAMEDYSLEEKAWLLQRAEVVVGPSGGGLANIVFCEPGTVVVELRVQPYPVMEAWDIGNRMGLQFYDVLPDGYVRSSTMDATVTGAVSEESVLATLEMAGVI